mgnify:CR=1 FL=1|jgi:hypothetical protein
MNKAIAGTDTENKTLEEVVVSSWNSGSPTPLFNNAAQVGGALGTAVGTVTAAAAEAALLW